MALFNAKLSIIKLPEWVFAIVPSQLPAIPAFAGSIRKYRRQSHLALPSSALNAAFSTEAIKPPGVEHRMPAFIILEYRQPEIKAINQNQK